MRVESSQSVELAASNQQTHNSWKLFLVPCHSLFLTTMSAELLAMPCSKQEDKENESPSSTDTERPSLTSLWRRRFGRAEHPVGSSPHISSKATAAPTPHADMSSAETMQCSESPRGQSEGRYTTMSTCARPRLQHAPHPGLALTTTSPSIQMCGPTPCNTPDVCYSSENWQEAADTESDGRTLAATGRKQHRTASAITARELAPAFERQLAVSIEEQWASPRRGEALHRGGGIRKHVLQLRTLAMIKLASTDADTVATCVSDSVANEEGK